MLAAVGNPLALVEFGLTWRWYPGTGAAMTLAGVTLVLAAVLWPGGIWADYPLRARLVAVVGALVAADDAVSHALGVWTPLDASFGQVYHLLPRQSQFLAARSTVPHHLRGKQSQKSSSEINRAKLDSLPCGENSPPNRRESGICSSVHDAARVQPTP